MATEEKTETVIIRVSKELKDKVQKLADKDHRTLSDFIRLSLIKLTETKAK
jgi:predicted transcriptional regulator